MKKTKKIIAIFGVALVLLSSVLGLIPPAAGRAYAAPFDDATVQEQVAAYIYMRALARCIKDAPLRDTQGGIGENIVDSNHASRWQWFSDGQLSLTTRTNTYLGIVDPDSGGGEPDGVKRCDQGDSWMPKAYSLFDNAWSDPITAICYSGFRRDDAGDGQEAADCINGNPQDEFRRDGGDSGALRQFLKNVNQHFYGKSNSTSMPGMTDAMQYYYYSQSLTVLCRANPVDATEQQAAADDQIFRIKGPDGTSYITLKSDDKNAGDKVTTTTNSSLGEQKHTCGELEKRANTPGWAEAFAKEEAANPGSATGGTETQSGAIDTSCGGFEGVESILNWVICPLITAATSAANGLENVIAGMLCINESDMFGTDMTCDGDPGTQQSRDAFHNAWNVFRILSLGLLAIAGLVMIFSQALGFEIFDAYTVKKTLPRILVAGIAITLSWQLLEFVVTFSNALGIGIRSLIYTPFLQSGMDDVVLRGGDGAIGLIFAGAGWVVLGPLGLLSFIATGLLAIIIAFFILVVRNMLVIFLVLVAPIAIAMYILPNTEKYFKLWWDWFFKALLAFPIITAIIAIGHVFAAISSQRGSGSSTLNSVVAFVAYFAPYFLIPAAFRFAGGALGTIGGFVNDRSRGGFDRLRQFRKGQSERRLGYFGQKYGNRVMQQRAEWVRNLNASASKEGRSRLTSGALRFAGRQVGGLGDIEERMSAIQAQQSKRASDKIATGKDDQERGLTVDMASADGSVAEQRALREEWQREQEAAKREGRVARTVTSANGLKRISGDGTVQYQSLGGGWVNKADVENAHREHGGDVAYMQAALSYEMRKAMEDGQVEGITDRFLTTAKRWGMTENQMQGAWIGAGFENQNQHLEFKHTKLKKDKDGNMYTELDYEAFAAEAYEKKGNYPLSQMSAHTVKQLEESYKLAEAAGDTETMTKLRAVSDTFVQSMGAGDLHRSEGGEPMEIETPGVPGRKQVHASGAGAVQKAAESFALRTGSMPASGIPTPPPEPDPPSDYRDTYL